MVSGWPCVFVCAGGCCGVAAVGVLAVVFYLCYCYISICIGR